MLVEDVMTTDVVTCDHEATLQAAATRMLERHVGSVIVTADGDPAGILTETDALQAGVVTDRPFSEITVGDVASHPLITVTRDVTVGRAVDRMREEDVKKLVVVDGLSLEGIVTRSDVVLHFGEFIDEAHAIDDRREDWEARRTDVDEF